VLFPCAVRATVSVSVTVLVPMPVSLSVWIFLVPMPVSLSVWIFLSVCMSAYTWSVASFLPLSVSVSVPMAVPTPVSLCPWCLLCVPTQCQTST